MQPDRPVQQCPHCKLPLTRQESLKPDCPVCRELLHDVEPDPYEFCIPNTAKCKAQVKAIDPGVRLMPGSRGRIGARKDECLCVGETGADYRTVLNRLAALPFIKRIIECHFE